MDSEKPLRRLNQIVQPPVGRALARLGLSPNLMTVIGILVTLWGAWVISQGEPFMGGLILIGGLFFDMFDGAIAKAANKETLAGAFLDSTLDRLGDAAIFVAIAWQYIYHPPLGANAKIGAALALGCLVLGTLISYMRSRAEALGFEGKAGIAERAERSILIVAGLVFGVLFPTLVLLSVLLLITVVQRFSSVWKQATQTSS